MKTRLLLVVLCILSLCLCTRAHADSETSNISVTVEPVTAIASGGNSYSLSTNMDHMKISISTSTPGEGFYVTLESPSGARSMGRIPLSSTESTAVTGIMAGGYQNLKIVVEGGSPDVILTLEHE